MLDFQNIFFDNFFLHFILVYYSIYRFFRRLFFSILCKVNWLTDSSVITGEINYKSLQMDRGAALNCRVVHNWDKKEQAKKQDQTDEVQDAKE